MYVSYCDSCSLFGASQICAGSIFMDLFWGVLSLCSMLNDKPVLPQFKKIISVLPDRSNLPTFHEYEQVLKW